MHIIDDAGPNHYILFTLCYVPRQGGLVPWKILFIYYKYDPEVVNPNRKPVRDLLLVGFDQPLAHFHQSLHPYVQAWALMGMGVGRL
jgi:hypothetical protein